MNSNNDIAMEFDEDRGGPRTADNRISLSPDDGRQVMNAAPWHNEAAEMERRKYGVLRAAGLRASWVR